MDTEQSCRLGSPRPKCRLLRFLVRALSLAWRWAPSRCVPPWLGVGGAGSRQAPWSLLTRTLITSGGPPPASAPLNLITSKRPHLLAPSHRRTGHQHTNFGVTHSVHKGEGTPHHQGLVRKQGEIRTEARRFCCGFRRKEQARQGKQA